MIAACTAEQLVNLGGKITEWAIDAHTRLSFRTFWDPSPWRGDLTDGSITDLKKLLCRHVEPSDQQGT